MCTIFLFFSFLCCYKWHRRWCVHGTPYQKTQIKLMDNAVGFREAFTKLNSKPSAELTNKWSIYIRTKWRQRVEIFLVVDVREQSKEYQFYWIKRSAFCFEFCRNIALKHHDTTYHLQMIPMWQRLQYLHHHRRRHRILNNPRHCASDRYSVDSYPRWNHSEIFQLD